MGEKVRKFLEEHRLFLCLLLFAIGIRLLYASSGIRYVGTDLSLQAYNLLHGQYDLNLLWYHLGVRYTLLLLVTGIYALFGISEITAMILPFFVSIGGIVLIYVIGRHIFSKQAGVLAAFFLAILPLDVVNATILETDSTMAFFAVLGLALYWYSRTKEKKLYLFVFVGIILAISALAKVFGVLLLFSIGLYEIVSIQYKSQERNKQIKDAVLRIFAIGVGFALIYSPILFWQYTETGDPLYNIHVEKYLMYAVTQFQDWPKPNYDFIPLSNDHITYLKYMFNPFRYESFFDEIMVDDGIHPMLNIFFYFIFAGVLYFCYRRNEKTTFLLCWFLVPFLFLQNYYFIVKVQRYLTITLIPGLLLAAFFCSKVYSEKIKQRISSKHMLLILSFLIVISLLSFYQLGKHTVFTPFATITVQDQGTFNILGYEEKMARLLLSVPEKDVYVTSYQTIPSLNFYFQYSKNYSGPHGYTGATNTSFYDLHFVSDLATIHDAYIIFEPSYFKEDLDVYNYYNYMNVTYPIQKLSIPDYWQLLYQNEGNTFLLFYAP